MSIPDNQRLIDLVRYQRHALQEAGLISNEEYAALVAVGSQAARRLESYDEVRARIDGLMTALAACRDRFAQYVTLHRAKRTAEGDRKAAENQYMFEVCDHALAEARR